MILIEKQIKRNEDTFITFINQEKFNQTVLIRIDKKKAKIKKDVQQSCILLPLVFNLYIKAMMK